MPDIFSDQMSEDFWLRFSTVSWPGKKKEKGGKKKEKGRKKREKVVRFTAKSLFHKAPFKFNLPLLSYDMDESKPDFAYRHTC
jgi:hypothetical protein